MKSPLRTPEYWVELSDRDLRTAATLPEGEAEYMVFFLCQQAIEKRLKGIFALVTGTTPPKVHGLLKLAEEDGLSLSPEAGDLFETLQRLYAAVRYDYVDIEGVEREPASVMLARTKEVAAWLDTEMSRLKSERS